MPRPPAPDNERVAMAKYWTKSWNVLYGCTKCRAGCTHCWAEVMARRLQANGVLDGVVDDKGNWTGNIVYKPERLLMPYSWKTPQIVAVNWMSDTFHANVPSEVWPALCEVMRDTPRHIYLVLTKRYEKMAEQIRHQLANVYFGVTISNQKDADEAREPLAECSRYGGKTWVSHEPALEVVDWSRYRYISGLVCGGESGTGAREMPEAAAISAKEFCLIHEIPFTFKQWGGKHGQGNMLNGTSWHGFPALDK